VGARVSRAEIGRAGEEAAAGFLTSLGYRVIARNVRFRVGELDLVAEEDGCLVFVEVKTRTGTGFGTAAEAVTPRKQQQLLRLGGIYLAGMAAAGNGPCRFDVVTVEPASGGGWTCAVIRNAFTAS
jgi:putative endonuclease